MAKATMGPMAPIERRSYRVQTAAVTRGMALKQGTADDQVVGAGAAGRIVGIAEESQATVGGIVSVIVFGECIAIADAAVNAQDAVKSVVTTSNLTPTTTANDEIAGIARSSAAAQGDEFVLLVNPQRY